MLRAHVEYFAKFRVGALGRELNAILTRPGVRAMATGRMPSSFNHRRTLARWASTSATMRFIEIRRRLSSAARLFLAFLGKLDAPALGSVRHDAAYDTARSAAGTLGPEEGTGLSDAF
jgi:hypothetical protein